MRYVVSALMIFSATLVEADEAFDQRVIAAIMANPEVVILALEALEQQRQDEANSVTKAIIDGFAEDLFGTDERVQLVEFFDYRCGYCARAAEEQKALPLDVQNAIRRIELPILGDVSRDLAKVSLAVRNVEGDEAYRTFHHAVFAAQGRIGSTELALQLVKQLGWDAERVADVAESQAVLAELRRNDVMAQRLGIQGTPTYVSRSEVHSGILSNDQIIEITSSEQEAKLRAE